MPDQQLQREDLVLHLLRGSSAPLTCEDISLRLPQLTWNQVFLAVEALSRRGDIILKRQGYDYEVTARRVE